MIALRKWLCLGGCFFGFSLSRAAEIPNIADMIEMLKGAAVSDVNGRTVDTVKSADASVPVTGVVTTFMANAEVIEEAIKMGANFIVSHEPIYYNHYDESEWLEEDPVYEYKRKLLEDNGIVVWRFHDYIHRFEPDPIIKSFVDRIEWADYSVNGTTIFEIPETTLSHVLDHLKNKLGTDQMRFVGDPKMSISRVAVMVGAPGGRRQISYVSEEKVDLLIAGEIAEWETSEYVRDSNEAGMPLGLIVTGHQPSEEDGMRWLADWLAEKYPKLPIAHIEAKSPFSYR